VNDRKLAPTMANKPQVCPLFSFLALKLQRSVV